MTSVSGNGLLASRQLTTRPSGSYDLNVREYGTAAASAIGLAQAAYQGGENAVSSVVRLSEQGLKALAEGAQDLGEALADGASAARDALSAGIDEIGEAVVGGVNAVVEGLEAVAEGVGELGSDVADYAGAVALVGQALIDELA